MECPRASGGLCPTPLDQGFLRKVALVSLGSPQYPLPRSAPPPPVDVSRRMGSVAGLLVLLSYALQGFGLALQVSHSFAGMTRVLGSLNCRGVCASVRLCALHAQNRAIGHRERPF